MTTRRCALAGAALAAAGAWAGGAAWPPRIVRFLAPVQAGAGVDLLLRHLAERVGARLLTRVLVDNRPGGNGLIAARALARAAPDGATFGLLGRSHSVLQALGAPIDLVRGVEPVTRLAETPCCIAVAPESAHRTVSDLRSLARSAASPASYGTTGIGSPAHLSVELWSAAAGGLHLTPVPFKGLHESLPALLAGDLAFVAGVLPSLLRLWRSGHVRLLALTSRARIALAPDLPTLAESGWPEATYEAWSGVFAPPRTAASVVTAMAGALREAAADAASRALADAAGVHIDASASPAAFRSEVAAALDQDARLARRLKLAFKP